ncbi:MAG: ABC transporter permease, partial [Pseudomonadota bacterium]
AIFTGGALALQIYSGGARFNAEAVVPQIVAIGMVRELGPVLVGLMIAARVTSSIAAEIATMKVTEQIDALVTLSTNPMKYLVAPRVLAALIIVFIQSIEEFALAFILGSPDFTTVPTILYSFLGFNFVRSNAAVVSLILVVPNVALMLVLERLLKSANPAMVSGKG